MKTFTSILDAEKAAQLFFSENFGYTNGVGINSAKDKVVEFYSKDDPGMDDTFTCTIEDGKLRKCHNAGQLVEII